MLIRRILYFQLLQILDHHQKNVARVRGKQKHKTVKADNKPTKTESKTGFTDSDFDKFMKEFDFK